jgi:hypothetical protein
MMNSMSTQLSNDRRPNIHAAHTDHERDLSCAVQARLQRSANRRLFQATALGVIRLAFAALLLAISITSTPVSRLASTRISPS